MLDCCNDADQKMHVCHVRRPDFIPFLSSSIPVAPLSPASPTGPQSVSVCLTGSRSLVSLGLS